MFLWKSEPLTIAAAAAAATSGIKVRCYKTRIRLADPATEPKHGSVSGHITCTLGGQQQVQWAARVAGMYWAAGAVYVA